MDQLYPGPQWWGSRFPTSYIHRGLALWSRELHRCLSSLLLIKRWQGVPRTSLRDTFYQHRLALRSRMAHKPYMAIQTTGGVRTITSWETIKIPKSLVIHWPGNVSCNEVQKQSPCPTPLFQWAREILRKILRILSQNTQNCSHWAISWGLQK